MIFYVNNVILIISAVLSVVLGEQTILGLSVDENPCAWSPEIMQRARGFGLSLDQILNEKCFYFVLEMLRKGEIPTDTLEITSRTNPFPSPEARQVQREILKLYGSYGTWTTLTLRAHNVNVVDTSLDLLKVFSRNPNAQELIFTEIRREDYESFVKYMDIMPSLKFKKVSFKSSSIIGDFLADIKLPRDIEELNFGVIFWTCDKQSQDLVKLLKQSGKTLKNFTIQYQGLPKSQDLIDALPNTLEHVNFFVFTLKLPTIERLQNLKNLSIVSPILHYDSSVISNFIESIPTNVQYLKLSIYVNDYVSKVLVRKLKELNHLNSFETNFDQMSSYSKVINALPSNLEHLALRNFTGVSTELFQLNFPRLKSLSINIEYGTVSEEFVNSIWNQLPESLEYLEFVFSNDIDTRKLALKQLPQNLKHLRLSFGKSFYENPSNLLIFTSMLSSSVESFDTKYIFQGSPYTKQFVLGLQNSPKLKQLSCDELFINRDETEQIEIIKSLPTSLELISFSSYMYDVELFLKYMPPNLTHFEWSNRAPVILDLFKSCEENKRICRRNS